MIYALLIAVLTPPVLQTTSGEAASDIGAFFEAIAGEWHGEGELFGQAAEFEMDWEWVLNQKFARLDYAIRGGVEMSAVAHYRPGEGADLDGVWLDTRGEILQLSGSATDKVLEIVWRSPTETGRTTYRFTGADAVQVNDYVEDGEGWRLFGQALYIRVSDSSG